MCTLYALRSTRAHIAALFGGAPATDAAVPPEVYPKRLAPVVLGSPQGTRTIKDMRWGFPPPATSKAPVVNVRNLASPFWRAALGNPARRCLVPATSFCEWEGAAGAKVKRWFSVPSQPVFAFAGLWRPTEQGAVFAFLTTEPNALIAPIHPKAMPVILAPEDHAAWLEADFPTITALAAPFPSQLMQMDA